MLCASGALDLRMGGPGYDVFEPNTNYVKVYTPKQSFGPAEWRRMVYQNKPRMRQDATFGEFDCPDASQTMARRNRSTTALQALNLLNGPFVMQQAALFAERLAARSGQRPPTNKFAAPFGWRSAAPPTTTNWPRPGSSSNSTAWSCFAAHCSTPTSFCI